jgi:ankyrin repeat protein
MLSFLSTGSGESDDATLCATKSVVSEEGTEILLHAITGGRQKDVKMILRMLAVDPNLKDAETGRYPLHVATVCGDLVMMEELLKCRAAPDARDKHGQTALHIAARKDMESAVELLLRKKADPNAEDNEGRTPLWHAAWHGDSPKTFQVLIRPNAQGTDIINHHCRDPDMPTALWAAAASPCLETAQALLKAGARTEVLDHQGSTVLHKAAWPIAAAIAPLLLDRGAEVSVQDKEGKLPLHRAAAVGKTSIVEALLERMDDGGVNETDRQGATALILGAQRGSLPLVRCLTEKWKAKCSVQDQWGNGAFYYACANGHILVATYLLGLGADINEGNKEGDTPLYVAAKWGHSEMVRLLLQLGADRSARSSQEASGVKGRATPAEVARKAGHEGVARMIETFELEDEPVTWRVEIIEPRRTGS